MEKVKDHLIGTIVDNSYKLKEWIGSGAFGNVYRAESIDGSIKQFVVKIIDPCADPSGNNKPNRGLVYNMVQNETDVIKQLNSRHVLTVYCLASNNMTGLAERFYIVTNYCKGGSMSKYTSQTQKGANSPIDFRVFKEGKNHIRPGAEVFGSILSEEMMRLYMRQIASVFYYYNHVDVKHLIHRDIKLDNIFIDGDNAVIGDFGLASVGKQKLTGKSGTLDYVAPEVSKGDPEYDCKADVFSLGITFYFLAYKTKPPIATKGANSLVTASCYGKQMSFPLLPEMSDEFKNLLQNMTEPKPGDRYDWKQVMNSSFILDRPKPPAKRAPYGLFEYEFDLDAKEFFRHVYRQLELSKTLLEELAAFNMSGSLTGQGVEYKIARRLQLLTPLFAKKSLCLARLTNNVLKKKEAINDMRGMPDFFQKKGELVTGQLSIFEKLFEAYCSASKSIIIPVAQEIKLDHLNIKKLMDDTDCRYLQEVEYQVEECIGRIARLSRELPPDPPNPAGQLSAKAKTVRALIFRCIMLNNHQKFTPVRQLGKKQEDLFNWKYFNLLYDSQSETVQPEVSEVKKAFFQEYFERLMNKAENFQ